MSTILSDSPAIIGPLHVIASDLQQRAWQVHLVGCGGTGSQMLTGLARMHVAMRALGHPAGLQITVYDPDLVTPANAARQLFSPVDVGRAKADILVYRLNTFFGLRWESICARYQVVAGMERGREPADLLITCVDSAQARREIRDRVQLPGPRPTYWLDCGNAEKSGQVMLTEPTCGAMTGGGIGRMYCDCSDCRDVPTRRLPTIEEALPDIFDGSADARDSELPSCSLAQALEDQDLFVNQWVATAGLQLLWTLFRDGGVSQYGSYINLESGRVLPVLLPEREGEGGDLYA